MCNQAHISDWWPQSEIWGKTAEKWLWQKSEAILSSNLYKAHFRIHNGTMADRNFLWLKQVTEIIKYCVRGIRKNINTRKREIYMPREWSFLTWLIICLMIQATVQVQWQWLSVNTEAVTLSDSQSFLCISVIMTYSQTSQEKFDALFCQQESAFFPKHRKSHEWLSCQFCVS